MSGAGGTGAQRRNRSVTAQSGLQIWGCAPLDAEARVVGGQGSRVAVRAGIDKEALELLLDASALTALALPPMELVPPQSASHGMPLVWRGPRQETAVALVEGVFSAAAIRHAIDGDMARCTARGLNLGGGERRVACRSGRPPRPQRLRGLSLGLSNCV